VIPEKIHFVWSGKRFPFAFALAIRSARERHPDWEILLHVGVEPESSWWNDVKGLGSIRAEQPEAILSAVPDIGPRLVDLYRRLETAVREIDPRHMLFLDGNHTETVAQHDYAGFARHLLPGGLLAVHDVFPDPRDGGAPPWHVVQRALGEGFTQVGDQGSLRLLKRTAGVVDPG